MALVTSNNTGNVWPGELEAGRIDAPSVQYAVDPTLPILGYDKRFESDQVVIGRGRLIGLKKDARVSNGAIATNSGKKHVNYITVADGVNIAPLGYAKSAIYKEWAEKPSRTMFDINRNYLISVPFVNGVNNAYGELQQGDSVTAYNSVDPRLKGSIVKYVSRQVVTDVATTNEVLVALPNVDVCKPVVLGGYTAAGAYVVPADITVAWDAVESAWKISAADLGAVTYSYGQGIEMKAGEVYSLETNTDLPGFMQWVKDNFGAWQVYPMFAALGNTGAASTIALEAKGEGYVGPAAETRIDPAKDIAIKVKAGQTVYLYDDSANSGAGGFVEYAAGSTLPKANFFGADNTQGKNYTVDPITGVVSYNGLFNDNAGADPMTADEVAAAIEMVASIYPLAPEPAFGTGLVGTVPNGIPSQFLKDPVTGNGAIGILKVAIH